MSNDPRAAMTATVQALYPRVKRFMRSKLPEPDCYDVANEVMRQFLAVDPTRVENPPAYLWGIARNQVLKYLERRRPAAPFDSTRMSVADVATSLSVRLDRRSRLLSALRSLPVDHQIAFELRHAEELTLEEVATAMGVSLAQVKRYIAAARAKLASTLATQELEINDSEAAQVAEAYRSG